MEAIDQVSDDVQNFRLGDMVTQQQYADQICPGHAWSAPSIACRKWSKDTPAARSLDVAHCPLIRHVVAGVILLGPDGPTRLFLPNAVAFLCCHTLFCPDAVVSSGKSCLVTLFTSQRDSLGAETSNLVIRASIFNPRLRHFVLLLVRPKVPSFGPLC